MKEPLPAIDPRILGKILLLQTTLHAIPTIEGIAEFVCRGLEEMPGAVSTAIRIRNIVRASEPEFADRLLSLLPDADPPDPDFPNRTDETRPTFRLPDNLFTIRIETLHQQYGDLVLNARDPVRLGAYRPFLESLANTVALTLENRENEVNLKRLNEGLEEAVRMRTRDLVLSNEALDRK